MSYKHIKALKHFSVLFNEAKQKEKYKLLNPLKLAGFTLKETRQFKFKASKRLWSSCRNNSKRNQGGRPATSHAIKKEIHDHLRNNSSFAANRFLKKENENALYRNMSYRSLYSTFSLKNKLGFSTFRKNIKNIYKKPHRFSDLCDYCERGKVSHLICIQTFNAMLYLYHKFTIIYPWNKSKSNSFIPRKNILFSNYKASINLFI